jgi:hypothetical protein
VLPVRVNALKALVPVIVKSLAPEVTVKFGALVPSKPAVLPHSIVAVAP